MYFWNSVKHSFYGNILALPCLKFAHTTATRKREDMYRQIARKYVEILGWGPMQAKFWILAWIALKAKSDGGCHGGGGGALTCCNELISLFHKCQWKMFLCWEVGGKKEGTTPVSAGVTGGLAAQTLPFPGATVSTRRVVTNATPNIRSRHSELYMSKSPALFDPHLLWQTVWVYLRR